MLCAGSSPAESFVTMNRKKLAWLLVAYGSNDKHLIENYKKMGRLTLQ